MMKTNWILGAALVAMGGLYAYDKLHAPLAVPPGEPREAPPLVARTIAPEAPPVAAPIPAPAPAAAPAAPIAAPPTAAPPTMPAVAPAASPVLSGPKAAETATPPAAPAATAAAAPATPAVASARATAPAAASDELMACDVVEGTEPRAAPPVAARAVPAAVFTPGTGEARKKALLAAIPADRIEAHVVKPGENLSRLAKANGVTVGLIRRLNGLASDVIRVGQTLAIPRGPFRAEVDRAAFRLSIFLGDVPVQQYAIGVGRDGSTPTGEFTVQSKVEDPEWTSPDGDFFAPGDPSNPLGTRWIGVTEGYGIHGTTDPTSIGREVSRGCVRLENAAVEEVYDFLGPGSRVTIR
jgi:lipoprotein-anchoring transpeptidase ErfK/SrfK